MRLLIALKLWIFRSEFSFTYFQTQQCYRLLYVTTFRLTDDGSGLRKLYSETEKFTVVTYTSVITGRMTSNKCVASRSCINSIRQSFILLTPVTANDYRVNIRYQLTGRVNNAYFSCMK